jgi:hypothetical protein
VNLNTVVLFHHPMAMKHCLEDDEIEMQQKCKIYDMGLHYRVLQGVSHKGVIQLHDGGRGGEYCIYIKQIRRKIYM